MDKQKWFTNGICFDHDLAMEHTKYSFENGRHENQLDPANANFVEKTGMDCAKWLMEYCIDNNNKFRLWNIQSANPCGKATINGLLNGFLKHQETEQ